MGKQEFFGVTVNVLNGRTFWQTGRFASVDELIKHVKRYSRSHKHLLVYTEDEKRELVFVEHLNAGTY